MALSVTTWEATPEIPHLQVAVLIQEASKTSGPTLLFIKTIFSTLTLPMEEAAVEAAAAAVAPAIKTKIKMIR